jgi:hypothetical protein
MVSIEVCVAMPCCMSRSRDAIGISFGKHFPNRFPNRVTSARLRRKENGVHHLNCYQRRQIAPGKWRQNPVIACGKLRQIRCRLLSPFAAHYNGTLFGITNRKGMVSSFSIPFLRLAIPHFSWPRERILSDG